MPDRITVVKLLGPERRYITLELSAALFVFAPSSCTGRAGCTTDFPAPAPRPALRRQMGTAPRGPRARRPPSGAPSTFVRGKQTNVRTLKCTHRSAVTAKNGGKKTKSGTYFSFRYGILRGKTASRWPYCRRHCRQVYRSEGVISTVCT